MENCDRCPTCGRPWHQVPRKCYNCKKTISRGDKFTFINVRGMTTLVHRNCNDTDSYYTELEKQALQKAKSSGGDKAYREERTKIIKGRTSKAKASKRVAKHSSGSRCKRSRVRT